MSMTMRWIQKSRVVAVVAVATATLSALLVSGAILILAILPRHLDEFLLTDESYCYSSLENEGRSDQPSIRVDYGEYKRMMPGETHDNLQQPERAQSRDGLLKRATHDFVWRALLHFWKSPTEDSGDSKMATSCPVPKMQLGGHSKAQDYVPLSNGPRKILHPMCQEYRLFRSRYRFDELLLPWNWYYRKRLRVRGLALRSSAENVAFVQKKDGERPPWRWMEGWIDAARIHAIPLSKKDPATDQFESTAQSSEGEGTPYPLWRLPPSLEFETLDFSFRSWTRPIVSVQMHGITINVVVQNGGFALPLQINDDHGFGEVADGSVLMLGDMTIQEALYLLPEPPEVHGLYPRIGFVNISNVSLQVYEKKTSSNGLSLKLLLKMNIPDKLFAPLANLTLAHKHSGIDQKDFQPMMESATFDSLRRHVLNEAVAAFHNSWAQAHKAQEQLQQLAVRTQELYLNRWIESTLQAWHTTQMNVWEGAVHGTAPLVKVVEDMVCDLKEIVLEPVPPLALVVSHHWNRTIEGINKHGNFSVDKQKIMGHFHEWISKMNDGKREWVISKQFAELRKSFDSFIAKSGQDLETLLENCELEVKDMWLTWHRQFMP